MNHEQPQPESQKPEEDLFDYARTYTQAPEQKPLSSPADSTEDVEYERWLQETFKCPTCQNGPGPCPNPDHVVQKPIPKDFFKYEVVSDDDSINEELQLAANSSKIQDFKTNAEAVEYMRQLWEQNQLPEDKKAS
jgi:hypothetical protein